MNAPTFHPQDRGPILPSGNRHYIGQIATFFISEALESNDFRVRSVYLEAGARFRPHIHPYDQILLFINGTGVVAIDGGEDQIVETGRFVVLPAGQVHMHGATAEGPALQLSLMRQEDPNITQPVTAFDCLIPDAWQKWRE